MHYYLTITGPFELRVMLLVLSNLHHNKIPTNVQAFNTMKISFYKQARYLCLFERVSLSRTIQNEHVSQNWRRLADCQGEVVSIMIKMFDVLVRHKTLKSTLYL